MRKTKQNCLITGAAGFIGSHVALAFHEAGYRLFGVDIHASGQPKLWASYSQCPCEAADYTKLMLGRAPAVICHLAGSASVPLSVEEPYRDFMSLLPGTVSLVNWLGTLHAKPHLILFSSAAVYGNPASLPVSENFVLSPISPYGVHKATAEYLLEQYARRFRFPLTILRLFSAYGVGLRKQLIWDITHKLLNAIEEGKHSISLHGTGNETRDFVHVKDIARVALKVAMQEGFEGVQKINVASGVETSISRVAQLVSEHLGTNIRIDFNGIVRAGDPLYWRADIMQLRAIQALPQVSFFDGIREAVDWIVRDSKQF